MDAAALELVRKTFGKGSGRVRLPGPVVVYDDVVSAEEVDPLQAMTWIAQTWQHYGSGRDFYPTRLEKITKYANAMREGTWEYRPDGDTIDITDGVVTGGRHRLHAILLSHTTQKFNVRRRTTKE